MPGPWPARASRAARVFAILALSLPFFPPEVQTAAGAGNPPLRSDATLLVQGHGWGHGRGMGQWGAEGMARDGTTAEEILSHFYSGVAIETRPNDPIRVLVERAGPDVVVTSEQSFTARWRGGSTITSADGATFLRAISTSSGYRLERSASAQGPWAAVADGTAAIIFSPGAAPLEVVFASGSPCTWSVCEFRGTVEARRTSDTAIAAINELPLEQYLRGVVPREMPSSWHAEALEAQATAARTYALRKREAARANGSSYDICADTQCQVYAGAARRRSPGETRYALETSATDAAIQATAGRAMTYGGNLILSEYSSSTGGYSIDGGTAYTKPVPDPGDDISPHHDWASKLTVSEVESKWPAVGRLTGVRVLKRYGCTECVWGGRVSKLSLDGTDGSVEISGNTLRSTFEWPGRSGGLKSTWFRVLTWNAEMVSAPASVSVAAGGTTSVEVQLRNAGTAWWRIGGPVRIAAGSSRFAGDSWMSPSRPAAVTRNVTNPGATSVRPGEVAGFRFTLDASDVAAGAYRETFGPVADGYSTMDPSFAVDVSVLTPWVEDLPNLITNGSFESGQAPWTGFGRHRGDGLSTQDPRLGSRALRLAGGGKPGFVQRVAVSGPAGRRFTLGGWSKTTGSTSGGGAVALTAALRGADGSTSYIQSPFPREPHGWRYAETSFTAPKPFVRMHVYAVFYYQTGEAFFDGVRLLDSALSNPSFEQGTAGWTGGRAGESDGADSSAVRDGNRSLHLASGAAPSFFQKIPLSGTAGSLYTLAGWARTVGTDPSGGEVALVVTFRNRDSTYSRTYASFPREPHDWTYVEASVRAEKDFRRADVFAVLYGQTGEAWFDGIRLVRNAVLNPSFEAGADGWTASGATGGDGPTDAQFADAARSLQVAATARTVFTRAAEIAGAAGRTLALSGWTQATGTDPDSGRISIVAGLRFADGTTTWYRLDASRAPHPWAYREMRFAAPKAFRRAQVYLVVEGQTGTVRFDAIRLTVE
ncbi:MAG: SpoIID/LytB domain-containing protein [Acidobacteria bacterium]|nr:SpoIID/LytB domain-containing protein [Acidobacteriota bacterium]